MLLSALVRKVPFCSRLISSRLRPKHGINISLLKWLSKSQKASKAVSSLQETGMLTSVHDVAGVEFFHTPYRRIPANILSLKGRTLNKPHPPWAYIYWLLGRKSFFNAKVLVPLVRCPGTVSNHMQPIYQNKNKVATIAGKSGQGRKRNSWKEKKNERTKMGQEGVMEGIW